MLHQPSASGRVAAVLLESPPQLPSGDTDLTSVLLPLHEFQLLSLLNGNPSHHEPRKAGERRARSSLSEHLYLFSSHLPYGPMHTRNTYGFHNVLLTLSDEFLTCYVKKTTLLSYSFRLGDTHSELLGHNLNAKPIILQTPNALPAGCPILTPIVWPLFPPFRSLVGRVVSVFQ